MHGFACRNSVHLVWRRRLLLALTAFGVFAVLSVLAPARSRPGLPMSPIWVRLGRPASGYWTRRTRATKGAPCHRCLVVPLPTPPPTLGGP
jgi:hypothetical protein